MYIRATEMSEIIERDEHKKEATPILTIRSGSVVILAASPLAWI